VEVWFGAGRELVADQWVGIGLVRGYLPEPCPDLIENGSVFLLIKDLGRPRGQSLVQGPYLWPRGPISRPGALFLVKLRGAMHLTAPPPPARPPPPNCPLPPPKPASPIPNQPQDPPQRPFPMYGLVGSVW
jgi:hypothetical protein